MVNNRNICMTRLFFYITDIFFNLFKSKPLFSKINAESIADCVGNLAAVVEQIKVLRFAGTSNVVEASNDLLGAVKPARGLLNNPEYGQGYETD